MNLEILSKKVLTNKIDTVVLCGTKRTFNTKFAPEEIQAKKQDKKAA